jgi:hypothetical protein
MNIETLLSAIGQSPSAIANLLGRLVETEGVSRGLLVQAALINTREMSGVFMRMLQNNPSTTDFMRDVLKEVLEKRDVACAANLYHGMAIDDMDVAGDFFVNILSSNGESKFAETLLVYVAEVDKDVAARMLLVGMVKAHETGQKPTAPLRCWVALETVNPKIAGIVLALLSERDPSIAADYVRGARRLLADLCGTT